MDNEVIYARLEKQGIPDELIKTVIKNLIVQQKIEKVEQHQPLYYSGLLKSRVGYIIGHYICICISRKDHIANWIYY